MAAAELFESRPQPVSGRSSQMVVALVGLAFEARIAATPHVFVLCGKDGRERFATVDAHVDTSCRALLSFGVAGGLAPHLKPGDIVIASSVLDVQTRRPTDSNWSSKLLNAMPEACFAPIVGIDAPVVDPGAKRELNERTGAAAVDMESHLVARLAAARGLAFVSIRVVVDPANRSVPPAAIAGMRPDGTTSIGAILASLAAKPSQAMSIARIAMDLYAARNALLGVRERLGHGFGLLDPDPPEFSPVVACERAGALCAEAGTRPTHLTGRATIGRCLARPFAFDRHGTRGVSRRQSADRRQTTLPRASAMTVETPAKANKISVSNDSRADLDTRLTPL